MADTDALPSAAQALRLMGFCLDVWTKHRDRELTKEDAKKAMSMASQLQSIWNEVVQTANAPEPELLLEEGKMSELDKKMEDLKAQGKEKADSLKKQAMQAMVANPGSGEVPVSARGQFLALMTVLAVLLVLVTLVLPVIIILPVIVLVLVVPIALVMLLIIKSITFILIPWRKKKKPAATTTTTTTPEPKKEKKEDMAATLPTTVASQQ